MKKLTPLPPAQISVGFIGIGVMGKSIASHLLKAGYCLSVYNRSQNKIQPLVEAGAMGCSSVAELARQSDVIFTMVGFPRDVREVYFGEQGILANAQPETILVDLTTSEPELAQEIFNAAKAKNMESLDAPVTGGDKGAREGTLTIMAGGEKEVFENILPIFKIFGKKIAHFGPAGAGQHTKMANQIVIAGNTLGMVEALWYAQQAGLDLPLVLDTISSGSAGSWGLTNYGPRILKGDYAPGFFIKHFIKDMEIALRQAQAKGLDLPALETALQVYHRAAAAGGQDLGIQGLFALREKIARERTDTF